MEVDANAEDSKTDILEFNAQNLANPKSPWFWAITMDDDDTEDESSDDGYETYGRGNAKSGKRNPYVLYKPSTVYSKVKGCLAPF